MVQKTSEIPAKALVVPTDAPNVITRAKTGGGGTKSDPQAGTSHEHHVSAIWV